MRQKHFTRFGGCDFSVEFIESLLLVFFALLFLFFVQNYDKCASVVIKLHP